MKKVALIVFASIFVLDCSPPKEQVEKIIEGDIEIIINHAEPYKIKGEAANLSLEKEMTIDFSSDDIGELGIADSTDFEVDSKGNIYFFSTDKEGDLIFKFDPNGNFTASFGRKGQGPEEIQYIVWTGIDSQDNIIVSDNGNRKILIFNKDGNLEKETRYPTKVGLLYPLENGHYFGLWDKHPAPSDKYMYVWAFSLYDTDFEEIKLLDTQNVYDFNTQGTRGIISRPFNTRQITVDNIFLACEDRGYEIVKYDLKGNLIQKIRKEYDPVAVSHEVIREREELYEPFGEKIWFPKFWPPMGDFFLDDEGRIFVMTFERGANPQEYIYDIFNANGLFIARKAINILILGDAYPCAKSRRGHLYCFQEKPDGFQEFNIYKMRWE